MWWTFIVIFAPRDLDLQHHIYATVIKMWDKYGINVKHMCIECKVHANTIISTIQIMCTVSLTRVIQPHIDYMYRAGTFCLTSIHLIHVEHICTKLYCQNYIIYASQHYRCSKSLWRINVSKINVCYRNALLLVELTSNTFSPFNSISAEAQTEFSSVEWMKLAQKACTINCTILG